MIIDNYLWKQVVQPAFLVLVLLVGIFSCYTMGTILNEGFAQGANNLPVSALLELTCLSVLIAMPILLPTAFFLGTVASMSRLYQDSELPVLLCLGWSEWRLTRSILIAALALMLFSTTLTIWLRPWAYTQSYQIKERLLQDLEFTRAVPGAFVSLGSQGWVFNTEKAVTLDDNTQELTNVFLYLEKPTEEHIIIAKQGVISPAVFGKKLHIQLQSGTMYWLKKGGHLYREHAFKELKFNVGSLTAGINRDGHKTMSISALIATGTPREIAELQGRLNNPLITFLLCLLAIPLSRSKPRQRGNQKILLAVVIYVAIFYLTNAIRKSVEQEVLSSFPGLWVLPAVLLIVVFLLYIKPALAKESTI